MKADGQEEAQVVKFLLSEDDMPRFWYNIVADLPFEAPPPIHPATGQPLCGRRT